MQILKLTGLILCGILLVLVVYLGYYGLFSRITVTEKSFDGFWMVYKKHTGPYQNIGPVMDSVYSGLLKDYSLKPTRGVGLYYDNPQEVAAEKCRSIGGSVLEPADIGHIGALKKDFDVRHYPAANAVVVEFPFKGKMSIFLGVFRVYPKLGQYMNEKGLSPCPILEFYDMTAKKILYVASTGIDQKVFDSFLEPEPTVPDTINSISETTVGDSL